MFNQVLVGVDGKQGGRDAVALARKLAGRVGTLTLAHVYPPPGDPTVRGYDDSVAAEITRARKLLAAATEWAAGHAQLRWTAARSPGRGLRELAEVVNADLLVVGSTHRGVLNRVLTGDDTSAVLDGAPCAVAIAPAGYAAQASSIARVGVGYDGSRESECAFGTARALAGELEATLTALKVVWFPTYLFQDPIASDSTKITDLIEEARERVAALGDVEPVAVYGQPAEELALWSASLDLLVLGSRGVGPAGRLVRGSTSQELARRARCPLLVVPRPRHEVARPDEEPRGEERAALAGR